MDSSGDIKIDTTYAAQHNFSLIFEVDEMEQYFILDLSTAACVHENVPLTLVLEAPFDANNQTYVTSNFTSDIPNCAMKSMSVVK